MTSLSITVLIPAYKSEFLSRLMESLCVQTDKNFTVLVGDDSGPMEIKAICEQYSSILNLQYVRFENNLGGKDLAAQWNRCLRLVEDEWVLMPGDDDTLHPECIHHLRSALTLTGGRYAAYKATLRGIDEQDREQYIHKPAEYEDSAQRLSALCDPNSRGMVIEYLFSKSKLQSIGGFVSFPVGWYSDTATWILLATQDGLFGVPDAIVNHRMSGSNLSSHHPELITKKHKASLAFLVWIDSNLNTIGASEWQWEQLKRILNWRIRLSLAQREIRDFCGLIVETASVISKVEKKSFPLELMRLIRLSFYLRFSRLGKFNKKHGLYKI